MPVKFVPTHLEDHLKTKHKIDVSRGQDKEIEQNGSKFIMKSKAILSKLKELEEDKSLRNSRYLGMVNGKSILELENPENKV